jgi:thymidine kinase
MRLTEEKEQTVIGSDNYVPVCRKCYIVWENIKKNDLN